MWQSIPIERIVHCSCAVLIPTCRDRNEVLPDLYSFPVGHYIIFYLIIPDGIEVVRVLHASRDIDEQLNPQQ
jgi:toxin ParE1/3/4